MAKTTRQARARRLNAAHSLLLDHRVLLRQIEEALSFYDSDDGHNDLILFGVRAEATRLARAFDELFPLGPPTPAKFTFRKRKARG